MDIEIPPSDPAFPPLMIVAHNHLKSEDIDAMRRVIHRSQTRRIPLVIDAGLKVYQLVDGQWEALPQEPQTGGEET